jgi:hypothetical protein
MLFDRASNPQEGFVFRANFCSGASSNSEQHCNFYSSKINMAIKVRESIEPIVMRARKQGLIINTSRNPDSAESKICKIEIRTGICVASLLMWSCWKQ